MSIRELSADEIYRLIDPELAAQLSNTLPPHLPDGPLTAAIVRAVDDRLQPAARPETADVVRVPTPGGNAVEVRLHEQPSDAAILWIHGGGLFLGDAVRDDPLCSALAD